MGGYQSGSWAVPQAGDTGRLNSNGGIGDGASGMDLEDIEEIEFIGLGDKLSMNREG